MSRTDYKTSSIMLKSNYMEKKREVASWLEQNFLDWMVEEGERKTVTAFAEYLGVQRTLLSRWLNPNDTLMPGNGNVINVANKLGPEIYDLLDWPRPII